MATKESPFGLVTPSSTGCSSPSTGSIFCPSRMKDATIMLIVFRTWRSIVLRPRASDSHTSTPSTVLRESYTGSA